MIRRINNNIPLPRLPRTYIDKHNMYTSSDWQQSNFFPNITFQHKICDIINVKRQKLAFNFMKARIVETHDDRHLYEFRPTTYILAYKVSNKALLGEDYQTYNINGGDVISFNSHNPHWFEASGWCSLLTVSLFY